MLLTCTLFTEARYEGSSGEDLKIQKMKRCMGMGKGYLIIIIFNEIVNRK